MGNHPLYWNQTQKRAWDLLVSLGIKGFRSKVFTTCLPVSGWIQDGEKIGPGRTLREGFIGQYRFWFGQIHFHEKHEFVDWGGWYRYPSRAWPDEAWERGLSRPLAKREKD